MGVRPIDLHFEELTVSHLPSLSRHAKRLVGAGRADDLVQETLLRALLARTSIDSVEKIGPWLHRILRNVFINEYWKSARETSVENLGNESQEEAPAHTSHGDPGLRIDLRRAVRELPRPLRETLVAVDVEGLAYQEAAHRTRSPIGTVMSRLARARERVAEKLAA